MNIKTHKTVIITDVTKKLLNSIMVYRILNTVSEKK